MRILFITSRNKKFGWSGVSLFRALQPAMALELNGYDIELDTGYQVRNGRMVSRATGNDADIVFIQTHLPRRPLVDNVIKARAAGQVVIGDLDDNIFFEAGDWHPKAQKFLDNKLNAIDFFNATTANVVSTPYIATLVPNATVIRNMINTSVYTFELPRKSIKLRIGYAGDTQHHYKDLQLLDGVIDPWLLKHKAKFVHIGNMQYEAVGGKAPMNPAGVSPYNLISVKWRPLLEFPASLHENRFDVGLVPLAHTYINRGKSAIKGLEYAATGIPYIASVHPEYEWLGAGLITDDFEAALNKLLDYDYRVHIAETAYERILREDINERWYDYKEFFDGYAN